MLLVDVGRKTLPYREILHFIVHISKGHSLILRIEMGFQTAVGSFLFKFRLDGE